MKTNFRFIGVLLFSALILFNITSCATGAKAADASAITGPEHNKAVVMQYFHDVLDLEQYTEMNDLFSPYVVMHRPEGDLTYLDVIQTAFQRGLGPHSMETTIHEIVASGDYVSVRLTHKLTYSTEEAFMHSRLGQFDVRGKIVKWDAMAMFRFKDGKIIEEWVSPDELGQLMQIGKVEFSAK